MQNNINVIRRGGRCHGTVSDFGGRKFPGFRFTATTLTVVACRRRCAQRKGARASAHDAPPRGRALENAQIADTLDEIADLLELTNGGVFRVRAFRDAAQTVRPHAARCEDLRADGADFSELPHIGKSTAENIGPPGPADNYCRMAKDAGVAPDAHTAFTLQGISIASEYDPDRAAELHFAR